MYKRRNVAMRVAHEDHIDARNLFSDADRVVFMRHLTGTDFSGTQILTESHVHRDYYDINFLLAHAVSVPIFLLR